MRYRLPSLNALRAFEAAGRRGSLSAAAEELGVTVGAVSRHVCLLEAHFGQPLLERHRTGVRPTLPGAQYLRSIAAAFDEVDAASTRLAASQGKLAPLKLHFYSSFATEWLVPRLSAFRERHPAVRLELVLSQHEPDWDGDFDMAMSAMPPARADLLAEPLFDTFLALVCRPGLIPAAREAAPDLAGQTLLLAPRERPLWPLTLKALGAAPLESHRELAFESLSLTYQAARGGAGVALGMLFMVIDDLRTGRLCLPYDRMIRLDLPHHVVCRHSRLANPALGLFRDWLMEEVAATRADMAGWIDARSVTPVSLSRQRPAFSFSEGSLDRIIQ